MAESSFKAFFEYIFILAKVFVIVLKSIFFTIFRKEKSVENEIVLITGAGSGLGKELSIQYANLGAEVVCWDINEESNRDTVNLIKSKGQKAFGFTVDVSNRDRVFEVASRVLTEIGDVSILIQNAGALVSREMLQHSENEIKKLFDVNLFAVCWMTHAFLPRMIEKNRGHIVGICSVSGLIATRNIVPYSASKFALRGLIEGIATELDANSKGKSNIKFTTIYPFYVNTTLFNADRVNIRFNSLSPVLSIEEVVKIIISSQRKEETEVSIPWHWLYIDRITRFLPREANLLFSNFVNAYIKSD